SPYRNDECKRIERRAARRLGKHFGARSDDSPRKYFMGQTRRAAAGLARAIARKRCEPNAGADRRRRRKPERHRNGYARFHSARDPNTGRNWRRFVSAEIVLFNALRALRGFHTWA